MKIARLVLLLLLFMTTFAVHASADYKKIKIAVLDFHVEGDFNKEQDIGNIAAEWLTTGLVETGRFDVIERRLLKKIAEEQKFGASGMTDSTSAARLGKILGVKTIVSGTVMKYDDFVEINARLLNVETGSIIAAEKVKSDKTRELSELVSQISRKLIQAFPLQGYVVKRSKDKVTVDIGRLTGIKGGTRLIVYKEGNVIKHPRTGEVLDIETIDLGMVEIREIKERTSLAIILNEISANAIQTGHLVRDAFKGERSDVHGREEAEQDSSGNKSWFRRKVWDKVKDTFKENSGGSEDRKDEPKQGQ